MSSASKQHMQVPKIFPPSPFMTFNRALYMAMFKTKTKTLRGFIYFWMGLSFPFVSAMRHRLLNLSSVRHSTNLQFINKEFSVGYNCHNMQKKGKIICKLVHCNVLGESWNGCLPWYAEERFLFLNKTCPSHHKTRHRLPLPRASLGVQWHTLITLAITI